MDKLFKNSNVLNNMLKCILFQKVLKAMLFNAQTSLISQNQGNNIRSIGKVIIL